MYLSPTYPQILAKTPMFYSDFYAFDDAIATAERYLQRYPDPEISILLGELYALTGAKDKLAALAESFMNSREASTPSRYYFVALQGFCENAPEAVADAMQYVEDAITSPLSDLFRIQAAIHLDKPADITRLYHDFMKRPPYYDFQKRAYSLAMSYILLKLDAGGYEEASPLAAEMINETPNEPLLLRVLIGNELRRNTLTGSDLNAALGRAPNDLFLLMAAAQYNLNMKLPEKAIQYADRYHAVIKDLLAAENIPVSTDEEQEAEAAERRARLIPSAMGRMAGDTAVDLVRIYAMDMLGKTEEAFDRFTALAEQNVADLRIVEQYFDFCISKKRVDMLESFSKAIREKNDPKLNELLPFFRAELLLRDGSTDSALDLLERAPCSFPRYIFRAALLLGANGRYDAAIRRLNEIAATYTPRSMVLVNLSEFYHKNGNDRMSLSTARAAFLADPNVPLTRIVYAKRLLEINDYSGVLSLLFTPAEKGDYSGDVMAIWSAAMRGRIKELYWKHQYESALKHCRELEKFYPDDVFVREYKQNSEVEFKRQREADEKEIAELMEQANAALKKEAAERAARRQP